MLLAEMQISIYGFSVSPEDDTLDDDYLLLPWVAAPACGLNTNAPFNFLLWSSTTSFEEFRASTTSPTNFDISLNCALVFTSSFDPLVIRTLAESPSRVTNSL